MKKLHFLDKLIYLVNSILAIVLLLSYLLPFVSPKNIPFFAILSLFAPLLIAINLVFVVYWLLRLKKQFLLSTIILLLGWTFNSTFFKIVGKNNVENNDLSVMSYNVRMFNQWKWIENDSIPKKIADVIKRENPDVLLLQEYYRIKNNPIKYPYQFINTKKDSGKIGLAIYSKFPIVNKGSLDLKNTANNIIFADIKRNKDTIRVYNLHLQSLQLNTEKENFGQENSEKLIERLKTSFKKQAEQTETFLAHQSSWKRKTIVAGDFNNTSYSWVYNQIASNKKDAFVKAGKGFGNTFNYWFPLRIDYILTDETATIQSFKVINEKNSDHYPIFSRLKW